MTLDSILKKGNNNFDLVRLLAALAVMFGHSFGIRGGENREWMLWLTHRESFGSLAVYAFFLISGMLVSSSYARQPSPTQFVILRAARIWPGAIVCALMIGLLIGPTFTWISWRDYFANEYTQRWLIHNVTLIGPVGGLLPGVFPHNHLAAFTNATVWTLPVELECYVIVLMLGLMGALKSKRRMSVAIVALTAAFFYFTAHRPDHFTLGHFFTMPMAYSFYPVPFFFLGMLLYTFRTRIKIHGALAATLVTAYLVERNNNGGALLLYPAFAYGVLWVASSPWLLKYQPRHDYSYGIYLYGFVVQQMLTDVFPDWSNYLNVIVAAPIAVLVAALSWHFVELPCLQLARRRHLRWSDDRPESVTAST